MHFKLKKKFGQNFLTDKNILKKISNIIPDNTDSMLEIGPGIGHLTDYLILRNLKNLTLIEIDTDFISTLKEKYEDNKKIIIRNNNILNENLMEFKKDTLIISNLPYNISSQVLVKLNNYFHFNRLILMFQKEFAERLLSSKLNNLNCLIGSFYEIKKEFNISRNSFWPVPKIESTVMSFKKRQKPLLDPSDIELFSKFKSSIFINKRKKISTILKKNNIKFSEFSDSNLRAEDYSLVNFIDLYKRLKPELINKFC